VSPLRRHVPNALTGARLAAIPVFVVLLWDAPGGHSVAAAWVFGAASATDYLDGYLARRYKIESRFGRLADPLADRLLIAAAVLLEWQHDRLHVLVPLLVIGRDLILLSGLGLAAERGYELSVIYVGKAATFILMTALAMIMLTTPDTRWPDVLLWIGIAMSLAAGLIYAYTVTRRLGKPSSST
jgi:CDP-diacylglycerol--glycerol-3-phosphate 3-phosphatidyltransferase